MAMLDRLQRDHPGVTFQIDETNDYRLFPFESVSRAPSWFQNGSPAPDHLLHNLWNLSPVRARLLARPARARGRALEAPPRRDPDGGGAAQPHHLLQRPAQAARGGASTRRPPGCASTALTATCSPRCSTRCWRTRSRSAGPHSSRGIPDAGRGALLAFRQDAEDPERRIPLRERPAGAALRPHRGPDRRLRGHGQLGGADPGPGRAAAREAPGARAAAWFPPPTGAAAWPRAPRSGLGTSGACGSATSAGACSRSVCSPPSEPAATTATA